MDAIKEQLEFYFGDANMSKDRFMKKVADEYGGYVPLNVLMTFNKLKSMGATFDLLKEAAKMSSQLKLSRDKTMIKRAKPLSKATDTDQRTLLCRGLAPDSTHESIKAALEKYGEVVYVSLPRRADTHTPKGIAYVEFKNVESLARALKCKDELHQFEIWSKEEWSTKKKKDKTVDEPSHCLLCFSNASRYWTKTGAREFFEMFGKVRFVHVRSGGDLLHPNNLMTCSMAMKRKSKPKSQQQQQQQKPEPLTKEQLDAAAQVLIEKKFELPCDREPADSDGYVCYYSKAAVEKCLFWQKLRNYRVGGVAVSLRLPDYKESETLMTEHANREQQQWAEWQEHANTQHKQEDKTKDDNDNDNEDNTIDDVSFVPGLILKFRINPQVSKPPNFQSVKTVVERIASVRVAFVDLKDNCGHIRLQSAEESCKVLSMFESDNQLKDLFQTMEIMTGSEEHNYWKNVKKKMTERQREKKMESGGNKANAAAASNSSGGGGSSSGGSAGGVANNHKKNNNNNNHNRERKPIIDKGHIHFGDNDDDHEKKESTLDKKDRKRPAEDGASKSQSKSSRN